MRPLFFRSDFGAGFASPSDDGGLEEFFEFCLSPRGQVRHLRLQAPAYLRPQLRDLRIPFRQQFPQPRSFSQYAARPASIIRQHQGDYFGH